MNIAAGSVGVVALLVAAQFALVKLAGKVFFYGRKEKTKCALAKTA
jgi:hypothetical protein